MKLLYNYLNGNVNTSIYDNGTRIMEYDGSPNPDFPSSIDCKITNWCDGGCPQCHEMSDTNGKHANLDELLNVISVMKNGVELAIGGGNPLSHPHLHSFLQELKNRNVITNITVNQKHIQQDSILLQKLLSEKLIRGLGISYSDKKYLNDIQPLLNNDTVFHLIMGINTLQDIEDLNKFCLENNNKCKILVLGYKQWGRGLNYYSQQVEDNKYQWYIRLASFFDNTNMVISFDNLAINQLNLKRYFTDKGWNKFFQGEDGVMTMYVDAVKREFAKSSTSCQRKSFDDISFVEYFKSLH